MQTIQWQPFSDKHKDYIHKSFECEMSVAEGAVRSGKTIDNCIAFCAELETHPDKIHLASGSSLPNAKLNIGDCNGFGIEYQFRGRCKWGKYKGNEALYVKTKTGEKIVIFAGGGKADSYKKILGNSYGMWIATEINEHYDSDDSRTSFIKVAMARLIASKRTKMFWDLNPCNPNHKIYKSYIDKYQKDGLLGGYNYAHFTIDDNLSITEERKEEIKSRYSPDTVWYKRDILGQRCVAVGLIYQHFADHTEDYLIDDEWLKENPINHLKFGVDFGGNGSKHSFTCTGYTYGLRYVVPLETELVEPKDPTDLEKSFALFIQKCYTKYRRGGDCYADSAEQVLIKGLKNVRNRENLPLNIYDARKMPVNDRIQMTLKLQATGRFKIHKDCVNLIEAIQQAVWNNKEGHEDERLDNGSFSVDSLDSFEYSLEPHINDLNNTF